MSVAEKNTLAVIIPVLNDATALEKNLKSWTSRRSRELAIITVDGGSEDDSFEIASSLSDHCLATQRGRATQMNAGAEIATSQYYLFLHADTFITEGGYRSLLECLQNTRPAWGFFLVSLNNPNPIYRIIEKMMNWRSTVTRVATGDQCLFVSTDAFEHVGGFEDAQLMEDVAISKRLRQLAQPSIIKMPVQTSTRRWEKHGVVKTILLMWLLRAAYFLGVSPERLHRLYY